MSARSASHARSLGSALLALAMSMVVAACGIAASPSTSAAPTGGASPAPTAAASLSPEELAKIYADIEQQVIDLRGLERRSEVKRTILDDAGIDAYARTSFDRDNPPEYVKAYERFYKAMGQLKPTDDLEQAFITLVSSGVLGVYDPKTKEMYVVSRGGDIGATQRATYAHEFDHALQDQHFDSQKLLLGGELDRSDTVLSRLSVLEGDAWLLMVKWTQQYLTPSQLQDFLSESLDPELLKTLATIPPVVTDQLNFPAETGLSFVLQTFQDGGWDAVDALYANPPDSTEQVMHRDKYVAHEKPIPVTIPADLATKMGTGWKESFQDTYGEFGLRGWLRNVITDPASPNTKADAAAAGWGGDRVAFLEGPDGAYAAVLDTHWDTSADADEFIEQANTAIKELPGPARVTRAADDRVVVLLGSDDAVVKAIGSATGVAR